MSDSEGDEESFYDAVEYLAKSGPIDLATGIDEAKLAMQLFMNNRFEEAKSLLRPWANESMYHALGSGTFQYLEAVLTFEQHQIESASESLEQSVEVCNKLRKKNSVYESLGKIMRRPNYDTFSEEEIHAELCYAECLLLRAVLTFIEDENLISFVKGGLRMRNCLHAYKECWNILKYRNWEGSKHKEHFESGVRMGVGAYNLLISMLPARIMKLLEFIGFSGNRDDIKETGLSQLLVGCELEGSLRQILCTMVLLGFHLFVSYVLGYGDGDLILAERLINQQLSVFPEGVWYNFFKGRLEYVKGNVNEAIVWYHKAWQSQSEWVQFHHLCYWELMWANSFKQDWCSARDFSDLLLHESRWSKTIYGYQKASFMCMMYEKLGRDERSELIQLFKDIPSWKQRIAGKSIPMEKFAVKKCERFFSQGNKLILPAVELLYLWNGFKVLGKQVDLVQPLLSLIEKNIRVLKKDDFNYVDNLCLLLLLRGMCLKNLGRHREAVDSFREVISHEKELIYDTYLAPYTTYELGISYWSQGSVELAVSTLENAKNNYKGYGVESRLHFRIHSALSELKNLKANGNSTTRSPTINGHPHNNLSHGSEVL